MTRKVFETDKTIAGIPYRSTLFKASKLEEAIKECVCEHTLSVSEGNDGTAAGGIEGAAPSPPLRSSTSTLQKRRDSTLSFSNGGGGHASGASKSPYTSLRWGNQNASLYDSRENRTKTYVAPDKRIVFFSLPPRLIHLIALWRLFTKILLRAETQYCFDPTIHGKNLLRSLIALFGKPDERRPLRA